MRLVLHQLVAEQRMFWRSREAAIFIFVFPLLLYSLLSSVYSHDIEFEGVERSSADVLLAGLFGYGAANTAFAGLAIILVGRRETGTLKRLRATPLPPAVYIVAVISSTLVVFALQAGALLVLGGVLFGASAPANTLGFAGAIVLGVVCFAGMGVGATALIVFALQAVALLVLGSVLFGASAPANTLGFAGAIVLGVVCFAGMGVGATALIRSADGASAVVNVVLLPMAFLSGSFGPRGDYPDVLRAIADVLPLTYFLDIVNGVYLDGDSLFADPGALAVVGAWGAVGVVVALRRFSWMPREA